MPKPKTTDTPPKATLARVRVRETKPRSDGRPGRPNDLSWHPAFIAALSETGLVKEAAKSAGIDRGTVYEHRKKFAEFAQAWDYIVAEWVEVAERELYRRAVEGNEECVGCNDDGPVMARKYSDRLLEFYLKAHKPSVYGDKSKLEVSGALTLPDEEAVAAAAKAESGLLLTIQASALNRLKGKEA